VAEVQLPQLGESVTEGIVTRWLVEVGDEVTVDQPIVEISTDKVDTEIPSPVAGTVTELRFDVDDTVEVGQTLAVIEAADTSADEAAGDADDDDDTRTATTATANPTRTRMTTRTPKPTRRASRPKRPTVTLRTATAGPRHEHRGGDGEPATRRRLRRKRIQPRHQRA
jgi:pyruvate dehydrogenase E2 component (dihydrolipoamide acetyltransferase)